MINDSKITKDASAADFNSVGEQLTAVREDVSRLADTVGGIAGRRGSRMVKDIAEGFDEAKHYAESQGRSADAAIGKSVSAHPYMTIGLAAVTGFLIGALWLR